MKESIIIRNQIEELEKISNRIDVIAEEWNLKPKDALNINLVIEELVTNTISYGYTDTHVHEISVDLVLDKKQLSIRIEDDANEFNPLNVQANETIGLSLNERVIGGLGIHLVKNLTDQVNYERIQNRNVITLIKNVDN
ncbi:MAG: ATP-binding protein [Bacteroidia bacterium]|nr:ATP-binding protein [Bacteroidia bacterium]